MLIKTYLSKLPVAQVVTVFQKYWSQILVFIVTATGCWYLWSPSPDKPETYKPGATQSDGSIILERKPDSEARADMMLPKGSKLQRKIAITLQSKNPIQSISGSVTVEETKTYQSKISEAAILVSDKEVKYECPPVTLDLALVKMPDDSQRVVASSQDGNILGAIDVPVESAKSNEEKKWAAGIVGDPFRQIGGIFVDRRFGWLQTGAELMQRESGQFPGQINVKMGVVF